MYHRIVERKLHAVFSGLNMGRIQAVTGELAPTATHYFIGKEHALSGVRRTSEAIDAWYQRLLRLLPDIQFRIDRILVNGPPWATVATIFWNETNSGTDGVRTSAEGVNIVRIVWGKVVEVRIYTDTKVLVATLDRLARAGHEEAHAAPIVS